MEHTPVMVEEVFRFLVNHPRGFYVDGTAGTGGHMEYLLERGGEEISLLGIDIDPEAIRRATARLSRYGRRVDLRVGNFADIDRFCEGRQVSGIFLDLGISSLQISDRERGFSYMSDGELDMRMGTQGRSVSEFIAGAEAGEIDRIICRYGEERKHRAITREIDRMRRSETFARTSQLREAVARAVPERKLIASLARTFQAFRIWANNELENLQEFLPRAVRVLRAGGRIVIISYHSLEDRIVKQFLKGEEKGCICPPDFPRCACGRLPTLKILAPKPVRPPESEIEKNVRSRSAKLRAAERNQNEYIPR